MVFKEGEVVLVHNGRGGYSPRGIQSVKKDGCDIVFGYYATFYTLKNIHKCPKSIIEAIRKGK